MENRNDKNPLRRLESLGQSIWLDFISRDAIENGSLKRWIDEDGISGVTSNPTIFEKAIDESELYDSSIAKLVDNGKSAEEIFIAISIQDIQHAADLFRPDYNRLDGKDGFVSVEVLPSAAHNLQETMDQAHMLWHSASRPNVMVKVPGTKEALPAIEALIAEGININITLLFGLPRYQKVAEAYIRGLEARVNKGQPIERISSVASFFLSRIDTLVDPELEKIMQGGGQKAELAKKAHGQIAISCAKVAYEDFRRYFYNDRFHALVEKGATVQRLLWASTSTKNPAYSDVKYVDALIGPETIDTIPTETLDAYRDHGNPAPRLEEQLDQAHEILNSLPSLGIDIDQVTQQLEDDGVKKFSDSYAKLMDSLEKKRSRVSAQHR